MENSLCGLLTYAPFRISGDSRKLLQGVCEGIHRQAQISFENIKMKLGEPSVLGMPTEKGMYVLDTNAAVVDISGIFFTSETTVEQKDHSRSHCLREKDLSNTETKYGERKAELFAVITFVENSGAYLGNAPLELRVNIGALSWF